ncbi:MAG: hypothetical protein NVSMB66_7400 [Candidatus Doudnabacteria bacterium]
MKAQKEIIPAKDIAYRLMIQNLEDFAVFMMDARGHITTWNKGAELQFGYKEKEVLGKDFSLIFTNEDKRLGLPKKELNEAKKNGRAEDERQHVNKKGQTFWCSGVVVKFEDSNGKFVGLSKVVRDISERKKNEETIKHQAMHDTLTGVANRRLMFEELAIALASSKKNKDIFALSFIDLDHFKTINDTEGHSTADLLLQKVAIKLAGSVGSENTVARFGGDEFVLILKNLKNRDQVNKIVKKVLKTLQPSYNINNKEIHIKASMGVAIYPEHGKDIGHLLKSADEALYDAKKAGGNCYKFYSKK